MLCCWRAVGDDKLFLEAYSRYKLVFRLMSWVESLPMIRLATLIVSVWWCICAYIVLVCMHVLMKVMTTHEHRILPFTNSPLNIIKSDSMVGSRWLLRPDVGFQVSSA